MKLITFKVPTPLGDALRIGALIDQQVVDLNLAYAAFLLTEGNTERFQVLSDVLVPSDMIDFFKGGKLSLEAAHQAVDFAKTRLTNGVELAGPNNEQIIYEFADVELMAPVPKPNSIRDTISFETHAKNFEKRTGKPMPQLWYEQPLYYKGNCNTVIGHNAPITWPDYTEKLDYELEFGIYIGKTGKNISAENASDYIAGYTIFNDVSARDSLQNEISMLLGPAKGKDMDTGNVMGPCLVTPDELDVSDLKMQARINGETWSEGSTSDMYWSFSKIIEFISKSETLYPGDFIGSGTIAYGCGDELERWIQRGDIVELEIEGIGILKNSVR